MTIIIMFKKIEAALY